MKRLEIQGVKEIRGSVESGYLKGIELADGTIIRIPIISVTGKKPGKTLFLSSTIHGQEITGIEIIRRLCRERIKPNRLTGRVIAVPISNPLAFNVSSYHTLRYDYQDLNRVFPGDPQGSITQRLAHSIWNVASTADYLIDLHCIPKGMGNGYGVVRPLGKPAVNNEVYKMARALGLTVTISLPKIVKETHEPPGLQAMAVTSDIPALLIELNDWRRISNSTVTAGVTGVLNVMTRLGMIKGRMIKQRNVKTLGPLYQKRIRANRGGILIPVADVGDYVKKDQEVSRIYDAHGNLVERVKAHVTGYVLAYPQMENQTVCEGDQVVTLGTSNN